MLGKKHLEALKKQMKRRACRPEPKSIAPSQLKASGTLENRLIRDHTDLLQNIEFALVTAYRETDEIDDKIVDAALRSAIRGIQSEDPKTQWILALLDGFRRNRQDVSDELWTDALRVVHTSVRRHSECRTGDTGYLDFVAPFVP